MRKDNTSIMLTVNEAIEISGLTRYCVMQLVHENKVKSIRSGTKFYVNYESLCKYLGCTGEERKASL